MKNYLACLGARKGATAAVAALVILTVGLGARALADDIELVPAGDAAAQSLEATGEDTHEAASDASGDVRYYRDSYGNAHEVSNATSFASAVDSGVASESWYVFGKEERDALPEINATIDVRGTVNIILEDFMSLGEGGCLHVSEGATLKIWPQGDKYYLFCGIQGCGSKTLIDNEGTVELCGISLRGASDCAICNHSKAKLDIRQTVIRENDGDAIRNEDGAHVRLADDNQIVENGGCGISGGDVAISGEPSVTHNGKGNVCLDTGKTIAVEERLGDRTVVGVKRPKGATGPLTSGFGAHNGGADPAHYFFSDDGFQLVVADGEVVCTAVRYIDEHGEMQEKASWECRDISDESFKDYGGFELGNSWYIVTKDRTFSERPNVVGDAKIILCDGATVNFKKGIRCVSGKLTIYAQSTGGNKGRLIATGTDEGAGIGGGNEESNGSEIVICGGRIEATAASGAAGIGGGDHGGCGTIRILGGDVTAQGGAIPWYSLDSSGGAGIGSGAGAKAGGTVEISGGEVDATGGACGAGIGSGDEAKTVAVTISGGTVNATGGCDAAGIGGGNQCGCDVTITGGNVTASSVKTSFDNNGAGIGTGNAGGSGRVTISGGTVTATGADNGAGIGSGDDARAITITISGGIVKACGEDEGAGIGGGDDTSGGTITITGGTVWAESRDGAGIGGGDGRDSGTITITGGHVEARNKHKGVAIGHGCSGKNKDIRLADHLTVRGMNGDRAKAEERVSVLNKWGHVWVEPCDHAGAGEGHDCEWCVDPNFDLGASQTPQPDTVFMPEVVE